MNNVNKEKEETSHLNQKAVLLLADNLGNNNMNNSGLGAEHQQATAFVNSKSGIGKLIVEESETPVEFEVYDLIEL